MDEPAIRLAAQWAAKDYPQFVSRIKEVREGLKFYLTWDRDPEQQLPVRIIDVPNFNQDASVFDNFLTQVGPALDRERDLFQETPAEIYIVRISKDHYILAPLIHHIAADAGTASEFGRDALARYHEILTGEKPDWSFEKHTISSTRKRMVRVKSENWRNAISQLRDAAKNIFEKAVLPLGQGFRHDFTQHHIKRILSVSETEMLSNLSLKNGVSLIDVLVASTNLAIDEWNRQRNLSPGFLTTSMSVNMKGRFRNFQGGNNSALIFFKFGPEEREDLHTFARSIASTRIKYFRKQMDFGFFQSVSRMTSSLRMFPFRIRRRIAGFLINRHKFSMAVTLLGVVWPKIENGKLTAETCLTRAGDLTMMEVHGIGYKLLSNTPILLIVYVFKNRLNFVLAAAGSLFTREESELFMDLIMKNTLEYAVQMPASHKFVQSAK